MPSTLWRRLAIHLSRSSGSSSSSKTASKSLFSSELISADSLTFPCKYLGTVPMFDDAHHAAHHPHDHDAQRIDLRSSFTASKQSKVRLYISPSSVCIGQDDLDQDEALLEIPLRSVAYCVIDRKCKHTVAFVSRNPETDLLECHAFVTNRPKQITTAFIQAFQLATGQSLDVNGL